MTPHVYVNLLRVELAAKSVAHADDSLAAVGDNLGFSAQGHFTRFFRDHAGLNPASSARFRGWVRHSRLFGKS